MKSWTTFLAISGALLTIAGCGHSPISAEKAVAANQSSSISKQEWCAQVEQFKDSPDWGCTWPPARFAPGDFGPATSLGRYNVVGAVWDEGDTALQKKLVVRPIGTVTVAATRTVQVGLGATLDLKSISPWLPEAAVTADVATSLTVSLALEEAEWRFYQNLPPAIADGLTDKSSDPKKQERLARAKNTLCLDTSAIVEGVLVGKLVATVKESAGGGGRAKLEWSKVDVKLSARVNSDRTLTVKNTAEQIAILYLVNPSRQMLGEFNICQPAGK